MGTYQELAPFRLATYQSNMDVATAFPLSTITRLARCFLFVGSSIVLIIVLICVCPLPSAAAANDSQRPQLDDAEATTRSSPAKVVTVRQSCTASKCDDYDALFFVHGIYGSAETFKNRDFDWPDEIPALIEGRKIDVYRIDYQSELLTWAKMDIASLDDVVYSIFNALHGSPRTGRGLLEQHRYRSIGFIAHSLGGNVVTSYIHTVKSELGHIERARHAYVVTLGTPAGGAQIANIGILLKNILQMRDPLLKSLERDNTFLRMISRWRESEDRKAQRFECRPVQLYVGVEGAPMTGISVVSIDSAKAPVENLATEVKIFNDYDHSRMAKPSSRADPLYKWVDAVLKKEIQRVNDWSNRPLCKD
jgi:hypothetical protein